MIFAFWKEYGLVRHYAYVNIAALKVCIFGLGHAQHKI
jgi:hypothetical protein